jgi:hypothetical protein
MTQIEDVFSRWVVRYRWLLIALTVPVVAVSAAGIGRLRISNDTRVFFDEESPRYQRLKALEDTYSREQGHLYIVAPEDGDVFTRETLTAVAELTAESWELPYSLRVNSIANFQYIRSQADDLIVEDLVPDPAALSRRDLERIRATALAEPTIVDRLISPSGHVTAVHVVLQMPVDTPEAVPEVAGLVIETTERFRARYPRIDFYATGSVMIDHAFGEASKRDLTTLAPVMFVTMATLIGVALHSVFATLAAVAVILLSMVTALGLAGWAGMTLNAVSVGAPGLILTLAVADSVHILATLYHSLAEGRSKHKAVAEALQINLQAVFLTSITTIIGFLSMNFSESPPFRDLGNIVALGVGVAFVFSVLLLPALMAVLPVSRPGGRAARIRIDCGRVADFVIARQEPVFWVMLILATLAGLGMTRIRLNDNFLTYFDETFAFRRATDFLIENLSGWDFIEYSIPSGRSGGIHDPEYLARIDAFARWYRKQPKVVFVYSLADTIKRLNRDLHGGDEDYHRIPDQRDLIAQYLLFYELSLPFGSDLNNRIDVDRSATRFQAVFESMSAKELREIDRRAQQWLQANWPDHMRAQGTGLSLLWAYITQRNIVSMLKGSFGALVLISAIMVVALRSLKFGLLSLVPNLLPPIVAFGLWGMFHEQVGLALSVVVAMTIGIVVDDTVHFLSKYRRARIQLGMSAEVAVRYAFQTVGTAMWVTSVALTTGFLILTLSHYRISEEMGAMCAVTIVAALVMDFLLLPTLLLKADRITDKLSRR